MVDPVLVCLAPVPVCLVIVLWCLCWRGLLIIGLNHLPVVEKAVTTPTGIPPFLLIMGIFEVTGRIGV